jgi:hypothetical protein
MVEVRAHDPPPPRRKPEDGFAAKGGQYAQDGLGRHGEQPA